MTLQPTNPDVSQAIWKPINSAHAIQSVYAAVVFSQPVTALIWKRIADAARDVAKNAGLTEEAAIQSIMVQFGTGLAPSPVSPGINPSQAGLEFFRRQTATSLSEKLTVEPNSLRLDCWAYTRWVGFEDKLGTFLGVLLPLFGQAVTIRQVALEYMDVFIASDAGDPDSSLIIDADCDCVAKKAFHATAQWHSHVGWFENQTEAQRTLVNADVTVGDANTPVGVRRSINIRTHQASHFLSNEMGDEEAQKLDVAKVLTLFKDHHNALKDRLGTILTVKGADMISLGGK